MCCVCAPNSGSLHVRPVQWGRWLKASCKMLLPTVPLSQCWYSHHQTPYFWSVDGMPTTEEEQGSFLWRETWTTKLYFRIFLDSCGATDFCGFPLIRYFGIWCLTVYLCIFSIYMLWVNMTACFINSLFQSGFNFVLICYYLRLFIDMVVLLMTKKFLLSFFVSWNQMLLLFFFSFSFFLSFLKQPIKTKMQSMRICEFLFELLVRGCFSDFLFCCCSFLFLFFISWRVIFKKFFVNRHV